MRGNEADRKHRLEEILQREDNDKDFDNGEPEDQAKDNSQQMDEDLAAAQATAEGYCVECKDQESFYSCEQCAEDFCEVCYAMLHRTGNRFRHIKKEIFKPNAKTTPAPPVNGMSASTSKGSSLSEETLADLPESKVIVSSGSSTFGDWIIERSKYIPMRLDLTERKLLRLLEAALNVSEYTDKVDILSYTSKSKRIIHQIKDLCAIISGLVVANDYRRGQELFAEKSFEDNEEFFQIIFEIGRRHKIMNPEKMRSAYGKLMYLLMDSTIDEIESTLGFSCVIPIKTVYSFLEERGGLDVLKNDLVADATKEIIADGKSRQQVQQEIRQKERAIEVLSRKYASSNLTPDEIKVCLYSIGDNHSFLRTNRDPCEKMLKYLTTYFQPTTMEEGFSLAIQSGRQGARLTHNHETQYWYINQTLNLWREIAHEMFYLWTLSDDDMLNNDYRLRDTGQGLQRLQHCPAVSKAMHTILHKAQQKAGYWVGSSVIHLGDSNVPNAFMFIDKYNQVARILNPIILTLEKIDDIAKDEGIHAYIRDTFGGVTKLRKTIVCDFFRMAFDGSGADNFFSAGSCIDGRLTSAWNWCSQIEKKPFFPIFLLTGFTGFDGENCSTGQKQICLPRALDQASRTRQLRHHLESLERDNFVALNEYEAIIATAAAAANVPGPAKQNPNVVGPIVGGSSLSPSSVSGIATPTGRSKGKKNLIDASGPCGLLANDLISIGSSSGHGPRRLALPKNPLHVLIDESGIADFGLDVPTYLTANMGPSQYPERKFCSVCGWKSKYRCNKCGMRYCDLKCLKTHEETRCSVYLLVDNDAESLKYITLDFKFIAAVGSQGSKRASNSTGHKA
ncbi:hypothetical protein BGZ50_005546 [Haplosporangium sp. Z 11]|nr:hypothetical protein BGZ50_005546 [Haplosporangium sp. Z 11]